MIEREQFVSNLLQESEIIQDPELAEYFSDLGEKREQLFSNIYDTLFSQKVSQIAKPKIKEIVNPILAGIIEVFLTSSEDAVNHRIVDQIQIFDHKTSQLVSNLHDLRASEYKLEFDGLSSQKIGILQSCDTSLFDLFTTEYGIAELAKKQLCAVLKDKLSAKYFSFVEQIIAKLSLLEYDIKNNKIILDVTNTLDRFILGTIRNHIAPFQLINQPNQDKQNFLKKLDGDLSDFIQEESYPLLTNAEILDIDFDTQEILLKTPGEIPADILLQLQAFFQNTTNHLNPGISLDQFVIKIAQPDTYLSFMQNYFAKFLYEAKIDVSAIPYKLLDFSFKNHTLSLGIPDRATYEKFDTFLCQNKSLMFSYFQQTNDQKSEKLRYHMMPNLFSKQPPQEPAQAIVVTSKKESTFKSSPLALKIDPNKTFENFHALSADKVQRILYTAQSRKNIAICGDSGTGKTHLAQALANHLGKDSVVGYTTGDAFLKNYIKSVADYQQPTDKSNPSFKKSVSYKDFIELFQGLDYLIIEDIESIEGTKVGTQTVLKTIVNQNPNMGLIVTSKKNLSDMVWQKKTSTVDGAKGEVDANISTELKLSPVLLEKIGDNNLKTIIVQQWKAFSDERKFAKELPVGVVNFLADRVNSSNYAQIFESIYLNVDEDFSCDRIFGVIQNFVSEGLKPTPDQIIHIVIESFLKHGDAWKPYLNFENMGIDVDAFLDKYNETTLRNKLGTPVKADSLEGIILRLCVFYIKDAYPKKKFTEIGSYLDNRKDCSKLCDEATSWLISSKASRGQQSLDQFMKGEIRSFLLDTYGIKEHQLSLF